MTTTLPPYEPQHRAGPLFGATTVHGAPRGPLRRVTVFALVLAAAVASFVVIRWITADDRRDFLGTDGWPAQGQGAYAIGTGLAHVSDGQRPAPIASMAKVMTAYLVLRALPLRNGADGPSFTVRPADVADTVRRRAREESLVAVRAGERLTERQALMAVLLPSANNVAVMVTRLVTPSLQEFVQRMNTTARALDMTHTIYTDPSGFDDATVSTAADQLRLARVAGSDPTLGSMMAAQTFRIPVQGTIRNTDVLLGRDGFVGMKTGSDDAAGGCFMFHARRTVGGVRTDVWGVVMGQPGRNLTLTGQYAARQLVRQVT